MWWRIVRLRSIAASVASVIALATVGCGSSTGHAPAQSIARPTDAEIKAASDELRMLRLTVFLERYYCVKREAFIDGVRFREMPVDRKRHLGEQLMRACELSPQDGSFTLIDDRNGRILMTFDRGRYDLRD